MSMSDVWLPRRRGSRRAERYYVGRRTEGTEVYVVSRRGLQPLTHLGYQGGAAFDWSSMCAGALELSFALLADTTESRPTALVCRRFCAEVVAGLEYPGFVLAAGDIAAWLLDTFSYAEGLGRRARVGLRWSALRWARSRFRRA